MSLTTIHERIGTACAKWGRRASTVTLVAVSKKQPQDRISAVYDAGHRDFGENYVQEAQQHWSGIKTADGRLCLHMTGPLQTNKVEEAIKLFDVIHTLDRPKLAKALSAAQEKYSKRLPCFIQVNIGDEPQKSGIDIKALDDFYKQCRDEYGLDITGLMCIPPVDRPPAPYYCLLAKKADQLKLQNLSMGMSQDLEQAIAAGATHVRIGSALFGERINA